MERKADRRRNESRVGGGEERIQGKLIANTISAEKIMYYSIAITAPSDDNYYSADRDSLSHSRTLEHDVCRRA